jgi:hypothetical protein
MALSPDDPVLAIDPKLATRRMGRSKGPEAHVVLADALDGVQPVENRDAAFYAVLGRDLATTGTETNLSPSGFSLWSWSSPPVEGARPAGVRRWSRSRSATAPDS